jgi:hypothetical protein
VGHWLPGRLAEVKKIIHVDEFQEPPGHFLEAYAMYMDGLKEA